MSKVNGIESKGIGWIVGSISLNLAIVLDNTGQPISGKPVAFR